MSAEAQLVEVPAAKVTLPAQSGWGRLPAAAGALGLVALGVAAGLGWSEPKQFHYSYLTAYLFYLSIALGGLLFVLIQFAVKAGWSVVVRRLAENAMITIPVLLVLFVPVAIGIPSLFKWADPKVVAGDHLLQGKAGYLNSTAFLIRAGVYFAVWLFLVFYYYSRSVKQDHTGDPALTRKMQILSGPGIILLGISLTFAAFDWIMSLDAHWYSTIFGAYFFAGMAVAIFAFMTILSIAMQAGGLLRDFITLEHFHDLGKLLFAFTMFWAYLAFSQYLLLWYANLPEETIWFYHRLSGGWTAASIFLAVGHFVVPFFFLMTRLTKRRRLLLLFGALWMLLMHYVDIYWLVMPNLHHHGPHISLLDVLTLVGIGGIFLAVVGWQMRRHALIPRRDPRLAQSLSFENM